MAKVHPIYKDHLRDNPDNLVEHSKDGMQLVLEKKYAFVYMRMILKWFTAVLGEERFHLSNEVFSIDFIAAAIQKCHPCKQSFDHIVNRLEECGFFSKWYDDEFIKATIKAPRVTVTEARALSMDDLQGAFYFLMIGNFLGFMELVTQLILATLYRKTKKKIFKRKKPKTIHRRRKRMHHANPWHTHR
nr:uncharacterized protein LOC107449070 [Parasteatoda tepidariorum]